MDAQRPFERPLPATLAHAIRRATWQRRLLLLVAVAAIGGLHVVGTSHQASTSWPIICALLVAGACVLRPRERRMEQLAARRGRAKAQTELEIKLDARRALADGRMHLFMALLSLVLLGLKLLVPESALMTRLTLYLAPFALLLAALWYTVKNLQRLQAKREALAGARE